MSGVRGAELRQYKLVLHFSVNILQFMSLFSTCMPSGPVANKRHFFDYLRCA